MTNDNLPGWYEATRPDIDLDERKITTPARTPVYKDNSKDDIELSRFVDPMGGAALLIGGAVVALGASIFGKKSTPPDNNAPSPGQLTGACLCYANAVKVALSWGQIAGESGAGSGYDIVRDNVTIATQNALGTTWMSSDIPESDKGQEHNYKVIGIKTKISTNVVKVKSWYSGTGTQILGGIFSTSQLLSCGVNNPPPMHTGVVTSISGIFE